MTQTPRTARRRVAHELRVRTAGVREVTDLGPSLRRVTVEGPELADFSSLGPTDHVKVFLADPATGLVRLPGDASGHPVRRDLTPRAHRRTADGGELDLDVVVHECHGVTAGPLARWVASVRPGDSLSFAGPRGSKLVPEGWSRVVLGADETALPAVARWLELLDPAVEVLVLAEVQGPGQESYLEGLRAGAEIRWLHRGRAAPGTATVLAEAFAALGGVDADTFVWVGGEAGSLVPVRRLLRRTWALPPYQAEVQGYWRRGVADFDHHAPIDPDDPD